MVSLAQNVGENLRHVPWNNNSTEYERWLENGLLLYEGYLRLHSLAPQRKKYYYCTRLSGVSLIRKPASQQRNTIKNYRRSDYRDWPALFMLHVSEIYAVQVWSQSQICLCGWINMALLKSRSSILHSTLNSAMKLELCLGY